MTKEALIEHTVSTLKKLPLEKVETISNIADNLLKGDSEISLKEIAAIAIKGKAFDFLNDDEDLYTVNDAKIKYK